MKMDGSSDTQNEYDLDGDIEIDLPAGAKAGLKDASQDIRLGTDLMNEHLKKSLPIAKGALKREKAEAQLNNKKKQIIDDDALDDKQRAELLKKLNQQSISAHSQTTSML